MEGISAVCPPQAAPKLSCGYCPPSEIAMTKARITISMLGSAHCAANVVSPVAAVWPKYTATFLDDWALKEYPVVESAEIPGLDPEVYAGAAPDPEEVCAELPVFDGDATGSVSLAELAADPESGVVVLGAAAFVRIVDDAAPEAIAVLLATTFVPSESPVTVAIASATVTVDCSVVVEEGPGSEMLSDAKGTTGEIEPTTELTESESIDAGKEEDIETTCSPFSPTKTPLGSVESSCPSRLYLLISIMMFSSICCNFWRTVSNWSIGTATVCLLTLAALGHTYSTKKFNPGTSTLF